MRRFAQCVNLSGDSERERGKELFRERYVRQLVSHAVVPFRGLIDSQLVYSMEFLCALLENASGSMQLGKQCNGGSC